MWKSGENLKKPHFLVILRELKGLEEIKNFSKILLEFFSPIHVIPSTGVTSAFLACFLRKNIVACDIFSAIFKYIPNDSLQKLPLYCLLEIISKWGKNKC